MCRWRAIEDGEVHADCRRLGAAADSDRDVDRTHPCFDERVTILYYYPNMQADLIDAVVEKGYRGIVIAGTGLGHVNRTVYPALERAHAAGVGTST